MDVCEKLSSAPVPEINEVSRANTDPTIIGTKNERLEEFCKQFVNLSEQKFSAFKTEASVGGEAKTGKTSKIAQGAAKGGLTLIPFCGKIISEIVGQFMNYPSGKVHRQKAKNVTKFLASMSIEDLREILMHTSGTLFWSYEAQFSEILDAGGSWQRAMEKIATDAVDRFVNYITKLGKNKPESDVDISLNSFVQAIISGASKKEIGDLKPGHTVRYHGQKSNTSELFEKVGIVEHKEESIKFYRKKHYDSKFGFRRLLPWESTDDLEVIKDGTIDVYNYELTSDKIHGVTQKILKNINENDPRFCSKNVCDIKSNLQEVHGKVDELKINDETTHKKLDDIHMTVEGVKKDLEGTKDNVDTVDNNSADFTTTWFSFNMIRNAFKFIGRSKELENLHQILQIDDETLKSNIAVVSGLGGVGKSALIREYVRKYKDEYEKVVWIDAETIELLTESFLELAKVVFGEQIHISRLSLTELVCKIYKKISAHKCLFIFDHAQALKSDPLRVEDIEAYLPLKADYNQNIHVLVTSRLQDWMGLKVFTLEEFKKDESGCFVKDALNTLHDDKIVSVFTDILQHLPLALRQATVYINKKDEVYQNRGCNFGIEDYIRRYKSQKKDLLDYKFYKYTMDKYKQTVYTTWKITMEKIEKTKYGALSSNILQWTAFLGSDNVLLSIFTKNADTVQQIEFAEALTLLKQYSMVRTVKPKISFTIPRLVHEVIRIDMQIKNQTETMMISLFEILQRFFSSYYISEKEEQREGLVLASHLEIFLKHVDNLNDDFEQKLKYQSKLLLWLADELLFSLKFTNDQKLLQIMDRILNLPVDYDENDLLILDRLPDAFSEQSEDPKRRKFLELCYVHKQRIFGESCLYLIKTLEQICILPNTTDQDRKDKLEMILKILEHNSEKNSMKLLPVLLKLVRLARGNLAEMDILASRILDLVNDGHEKNKEVVLALEELKEIYKLHSDSQINHKLKVMV
ncbi:uncharacterized protein LOC113364182 [Ctenocephalides felis]|uniref:uncharacterized protein LOC113364182 n=1 Tax=Ctenocephalides felis TaxID=7515 RepID=UPI000E6E1DA5|nr:uncharacterized protein LOC113364182 [Ctenocephalides felis]